MARVAAARLKVARLKSARLKAARVAALPLAVAVVVLIGLVPLASAPAGASTRAHAAAASQSPLGSPTPWNGVNPFKCTVQDAGTGTSVPDPKADPYCVHFDKTNQNLTGLGIATFLLKEPARVAAALPKCFYFQEDHWRGSVVQSDGRTVLYEFIGHYFFDEATGNGGAWVTGFSVHGQTFDPTTLPGFPPAYGQYFGPGTGGVITQNEVPANPRCVALAKKDPAAIYASSASAPTCVAGGGRVSSRGLGPVALGAREQVVRAELGPPPSVKRGFLHYCVQGGGSLLVGQRGDRTGTLGTGGNARSVLLATTSRSFTLVTRHGALRVGSPTRALRSAFPHARPFARVNRLYAWRLAPGIVALTHHGHLRYLATYDAAAMRTRHSLHGYLARAT